MSLYATTTTAATAATVTSNDTHESHAVDWTDTVDDYYKTTIAAAAASAVPRRARVSVWVGECDAAVTGRDNYNLLYYWPFLDDEWCASARERVREKDSESDQQVRGGDGHRIKTKNALRHRLTRVLLCIKSYILLLLLLSSSSFFFPPPQRVGLTTAFQRFSRTLL